MTDSIKHLKAADLIYAATSRCLCGAGLAYPIYATAYGPDAHWSCSAILTGTAQEDVAHVAALPFMFYEIKSEQQPSAEGATTRPPEDENAKMEREFSERLHELQNIAEQLADIRLRRVELDAREVELNRNQDFARRRHQELRAWKFAKGETTDV